VSNKRPKHLNGSKTKFFINYISSFMGLRRSITAILSHTLYLRLFLQFEDKENSTLYYSVIFILLMLTFLGLL